MISDILHEAEIGLEYYLTSRVYSGAYTGQMRVRLTELLHTIQALRQELDTPPQNPYESAHNQAKE